jgi:hypothetical protein
VGGIKQKLNIPRAQMMSTLFRPAIGPISSLVGGRSGDESGGGGEGGR